MRFYFATAHAITPVTREPLYLGYAMVYQRADAVYVCAQNRTEWRSAGFLIQGEHVTRLGCDIPADTLGQAVADALSAGKAGVPAPARSEMALLVKPLVRAAGVRSWRAFLRGTRACFAERQLESIKLSPSIAGSREARKGFLVRPGYDVFVQTGASPADLGRAVREALAQCVVAVSRLSSTE